MNWTQHYPETADEQREEAFRRAIKYFTQLVDSRIIHSNDEED